MLRTTLRSVTLPSRRPEVCGGLRKIDWKKTTWPPVCRKQKTYFRDAPQMANNIVFFHICVTSVFCRGQPLAPYTTHLHDIFETVIYIHWPFPTLSRLIVGWFYVEIEGISLNKLSFCQLYTIYNVKHKGHRVKSAPRSLIFQLFPLRRWEIISACLFQQNILKSFQEHPGILIIFPKCKMNVEIEINAVQKKVDSMLGSKRACKGSPLLLFK